MAVKYRDTDFMYSSARVRAMETRLATGEQTEHLIDAKGSSDIIAMLPELGFEIIKSDEEAGGKVLREQTLMTVLKEAYGDIEKITGEQGIVSFLRYPYDCNNIKAVIKCFSRNVSPDDMLIPLGTVDIEAVKSAFSNKNYDCFPKNMAKAIGEAEEEFSKTKNPQVVDLMIDKACYRDMLESAEHSNVAFSLGLVRAKIDLTNIMSCIRVIRMNMGAYARGFFEGVTIDGGSLAQDLFLTALSGGEQKLSEALEATEYSSLAKHIGNNTRLSAIEKAVDDFYMQKTKQAKYIPFGAEVSVGYLLALETEVKNIRIILAGKDAGLSSDIIRERLRESYV